VRDPEKTLDRHISRSRELANILGTGFGLDRAQSLFLCTTGPLVPTFYGGNPVRVDPIHRAKQTMGGVGAHDLIIERGTVRIEYPDAVFARPISMGHWKALKREQRLLEEWFEDRRRKTFPGHSLSEKPRHSPPMYGPNRFRPFSPYPTFEQRAGFMAWHSYA